MSAQFAGGTFLNKSYPRNQQERTAVARADTGHFVVRVRGPEIKNGSDAKQGYHQLCDHRLDSHADLSAGDHIADNSSDGIQGDKVRIQQTRVRRSARCFTLFVVPTAYTFLAKRHSLANDEPVVVLPRAAE